jgi:hypothetical protein
MAFLLSMRLKKPGAVNLLMGAIVDFSDMGYFPPVDS